MISSQSLKQQLIKSVIQQISGDFLQIPKVALKAFKGINALTLAILLDLERYANFENKGKQKRFFCKIEYLSKKLGIGTATAQRALKFFENKGLINAIQHNDSNTKYYEINKVALAEYIISSGALIDDEPPQTPDEPTHQPQDEPTPQVQTKSKTKYTMLKDENEILSIAKREIELLPNQPKGDFELFGLYLLEIAKRDKGISEFVICERVREFAKLDFLQSESPNSRISKARQRGWLSLVFQNDKFTAGGFKQSTIQHDHKDNNANFNENITHLNDDRDEKIKKISHKLSIDGVNFNDKE